MKVRTEAKREAIIEAAATLFQEFGYEGASMNELAKRLRGSKATLYGYFPSKEELFSAVVRSFATDHLAEATQALPAAVKDTTELKTVLLRFAEQMLLVLTNDTKAIAINRLVIAEAGRSDAGELFHQAGPDECIAALARLLQKSMSLRLLQRGDALLSARQLLALITAETTPRMYQRHPAPIALPAIRRMCKRAVEMFLAGSAPQKDAG